MDGIAEGFGKNKILAHRERDHLGFNTELNKEGPDSRQRALSRQTREMSKRDPRRLPAVPRYYCKKESYQNIDLLVLILTYCCFEVTWDMLFPFILRACSNRSGINYS
jgi:hypothetical protein